MKNLSNERGSVTVWVAVLLGGMLLGFGGLVYDAAGAATLRSEIVDASWSLARTGANQVTQTSTGSAIDTAAAQTAINEAAARQWPELDVTTSITADQVTVTVSGSYQHRMLSVLGISNWDITASRTSTVET